MARKRKRGRVLLAFLLGTFLVNLIGEAIGLKGNFPVQKSHFIGEEFRFLSQYCLCRASSLLIAADSANG